MKLKRMSLRVKIFIYISGFAIIILLILWLFQIILLDDFYKNVKIGQVKDTANSIVDEINNDKLSEYLDAITENSDYCIRILEKQGSDGSGKEYYERLENRSLCGLQVVSEQEINNLYRDASENDGSAIKISDSTKIAIVNEEGLIEENYTNKYNKNFEGITLGKIVESKDGMKYFIIVNSRITPDTETVNTLKQQILIITVILVALTAIIAYLIASRISKPIRKTNEKAKQLADGKLDISFDGKGYLEIEELNDTLTYAVNELSKVERMRNELIANMSHDLRTPLTMIAGYSEAIRDLPGEDTKENIQVIIDESQRLTTLVNNILDLSKIQTKNEELHYAKFNLTELTKSIITRFNTMLEKDDYHLVFEPSADVFVNADEMKLSQVIYNIIGNAIHYTGTDKTVYVRQIINKGTVRMEIEDTGKGIKEEDIPYVWDRYYKLKTNHKRQQLGTGLGLSIVRGVLELHKARYGVISEKGKGAIFYFELPIRK